MQHEVSRNDRTIVPAAPELVRQAERDHRALCDPETGLPSLTLLLDRLGRTADLARLEDRSVSVIAFRVHGDRADAISRFGEALEASVGDLTTVGRAAPDVFVVVTDEPTTTVEVEEHMVDLLRAAIDPDDPLQVTPAGILCSGEISPASALSCALDRTWQLDLDAPVGALFGGEQAQGGTADLSSVTREIRDAVTEVHYQPVVDPATGIEVGAEALVRASDLSGRRIDAGEFIRRAERTGTIIDLGARVLHAAASAAVHWRPDTWVAVNVSPIQLAVPAFEPLVLHMLDRTGLEPHRLVLEITESAVMSPGGIPLRNVHRLAAHGVRFALDDFGTGFSSIERLRHLPVHHIKIDKSIIDDVCVIGSGGLAVVRSIMGIARALDMTVIAEGVETELQRDTLLRLGLDLCQGHLFGAARARVLSPRAR